MFSEALTIHSTTSERMRRVHPDACPSPLINCVMLLQVNSFGLTQDAGMGWDPAKLGGQEFLLLSTHGGLRAEDGTPIALGYHTGHWEVGLLVAEAAREMKRWRRSRLPAPAPTRATGARRAPRACSILCRIVTMHPLFCAA